MQAWPKKAKLFYYEKNAVDTSFLIGLTQSIMLWKNTLSPYGYGNTTATLRQHYRNTPKIKNKKPRLKPLEQDAKVDFFHKKYTKPYKQPAASRFRQTTTQSQPIYS